MRATLCLLLVAAAAVALPAAALADPPANDSQTSAIVIDATSSASDGTTQDATLAKTDPSVCGDSVTGTVWYALATVPDRNVVLRLTTAGGLDASVAVYRLRSGRLSSVECNETDENGIATIAFSARDGDLVVIGQQTGSGPGTFTLAALVPQLPGRTLHGAGRGTVEEFLDESDLWHVGLTAGTTYRISFVVPGDGCPTFALYRPGGLDDAHQSLLLRCNRSASFTPGPDGGGRYLVLVGIAYSSGRVPYRIEVSRAQPDDTAPGLALPVGVWHSGRLHPSQADQLDMYRFVLADRSDVTLRLARPWPHNVSLQLLRDSGKSLDRGHAIRRPLAPGTYYVVVSAPTGGHMVGYRLMLRKHGVSTLSIPELQKRHAALGIPLTLSAVIGRPTGRVATVEIDRLDPLQGWLFLRDVRMRVALDASASVTWTPSSVGIYRVRVTAPSRSGYVTFSVAVPPSGT
jgi:hypothetical protein